MLTIEELIQIVNKECYKVKDDGTVVWRSGMDAGADDPLIGKNIKAVTNPETLATPEKYLIKCK